MSIDNTGVIDIRVVREWLALRDTVYHGTCLTSLLSGFDDNGVYLFCTECSERIYIGLDTYKAMEREMENV